MHSRSRYRTAEYNRTFLIKGNISEDGTPIVQEVSESSLRNPLRCFCSLCRPSLQLLRCLDLP